MYINSDIDNNEIPAYLGEILQKLGCVYNQNFEEVKNTVTWPDDKLCEYLGTYYERTYLETKLILENVFKEKKLQSFLKTHREFNILDIGSGPGPCSIAVCDFLLEKFPNITIKIDCIDGKDGFLTYFELIIEEFNKIFNSNILLRKHCFTFDDTSKFSIEIKKIIEQSFQGKKYQFILCSKFINELYRFYYKENCNLNLYTQVCQIAETYLENQGFFYLVDVTDKINQYGDYLNIIMNKEIKEFYRKTKKSELQIVFPVPCGIWINNCNQNECFSQINVPFKSMNKFNNISKINLKFFIKSKNEYYSNNDKKNKTIYRIKDNNYPTNQYCYQGKLRRNIFCLNNDDLTVEDLNKCIILNLVEKDTLKINIENVRKIKRNRDNSVSDQLIEKLTICDFQVREGMLGEEING